MMHAQMIVFAIVVAALSRWANQRFPHDKSSGTVGWTRTLSAFIAPPLFLLMTAVAIVTMGPFSMVPIEGWLSYGVSLAFVVGAIGCWGYLAWLSVVAHRRISGYPRQTIATAMQTLSGRIVDTDAVFSAQVGVWPSELVVTQGLLDCLDEEHLDAVLAHESGHAYYRDTFWFFFLGGLRRSTGWLPYTEPLWQDLLLLRELRADDWATRRVDKLVLAEALVSVISAPLMLNQSVYAGFSCAAPRSRLSLRIDALLAEDAVGAEPTSDLWADHWFAIALSLTPLLTVPFHH